jgi:hypothetical protein
MAATGLQAAASTFAGAALRVKAPKRAQVRRGLPARARHRGFAGVPEA